MHLEKLYKSLVESRLRNYCAVWGNCGKILKNKLQSRQCRAARVVCKAASKTDDEVALENLGRLTNRTLYCRIDIENQKWVCSHLYF